MKYKVGDEVVIKTWEKIMSEYSPVGEDLVEEHSHLSNAISVNGCLFTKDMEDEINSRYFDRIMVIEDVVLKTKRYIMKGNLWNWTDGMIDYKISRSHLLNSVDERMEMLDL